MNDARDAKIRAWVAEGSGTHGDTYMYESEVWWGYWSQVGGDTVELPDAMFPTEELAFAYATLMRQPHDWHVGPVVCDMSIRDNVEVPE